MKAEQSNARNILPRLPQGAGSNLKSYSPTQLHFLMRLSHLQRQRRDLVNVADGTDWVVIARPGVAEYLRERGGAALGERLAELAGRLAEEARA